MDVTATELNTKYVDIVLQWLILVFFVFDKVSKNEQLGDLYIVPSDWNVMGFERAREAIWKISVTDFCLQKHLLWPQLSCH